MNKIGLCSVTFRHLPAEAVIDRAKQAGLNGIEWGGDVHVPASDYKRAAEIGKSTKNAGLEVVSYGSYYQVGEENEDAFETILKTAVHLTAPGIRVWAGKKGSDSANAAYREQVVNDAKRIAKLAEQSNVNIHFEYHGGTLTDTPESAVKFIQNVDCPNVFLYWQPSVGETVENRVASIKKVAPWLTHVHVFYWEELERLPLNKGKTEWKKYIETIDQVDYADRIPADEAKQPARYFMLEFVQEDDDGQFFEDAKTLTSLLEEKNN